MKDKEQSGRPSTSDLVINDTDETVQDRCMMLKHSRCTLIFHMALRKTLYMNVWSTRKCAPGGSPNNCPTKKKVKRLATSITNLQHYAFLLGITTESKMESKEWNTKSHQHVKRFKTVTSSGQVMASIFWGFRGVFLVAFIECGIMPAAAYQRH
ncbi:hypothetical protein PR048_013483 [Dryococelus australis]|uniref:Uncharacterized protein n=1 Tax=Dryococelus australis TaxID=614101 RepID=A0ABQ9HSA5_9NEOP|nr:hypothetical protein PR048_013483 [Dryococelus australis]